MPPEIEEIAEAGTAAHERFIADSKAIVRGWREGKLPDVVTKIRERAINEFSRDNDGTEPGEPVPAG